MLGIQNMLHQWFEDTESQFWDQTLKKRGSDDFGHSYGKLPYQLWSVSKYGTCADAAITGIMPPPLMEIQVYSPCLFKYSDAFSFNCMKWRKIIKTHIASKT